MKNIILKLGGIIFILALADQISKKIVFFKAQEPTVIIENIFKIFYVENKGIAFSIPIPFEIIIVTSLLLLGFIVYLAFKELDLRKNLSIFLVSLLLAGGIGNLIDRFLYGHVIDFISIWKYPLFNFADTYITIGALAFLVFYDKIKRLKKQKNK